MRSEKRPCSEGGERPCDRVTLSLSPTGQARRQATGPGQSTGWPWLGGSTSPLLDLPTSRLTHFSTSRLVEWSTGQSQPIRAQTSPEGFHMSGECGHFDRRPVRPPPNTSNHLSPTYIGDTAPALTHSKIGLLPFDRAAAKELEGRSAKELRSIRGKRLVMRWRSVPRGHKPRTRSTRALISGERSRLLWRWA
jgi:hypothetical protein